MDIYITHVDERSAFTKIEYNDRVRNQVNEIIERHTDSQKDNQRHYFIFIGIDSNI